MAELTEDDVRGAKLVEPQCYSAGSDEVACMPWNTDSNIYQESEVN